MTIKIFPTIYALTLDEFEKKLKKVRFAPNIHLDFMDGKFTQKKSIKFNEFKKISNFENNFEVHIMGFEPLKYLKNIKSFGIQKVLIHCEIFPSVKEGNKIIEKYLKENIEIFLVINPSTNVNEIFPYLKNEEIKGVMFMSVIPGKEGQKFMSSIIKKIKIINQKFPKIMIQVDGGINDKNIKTIISQKIKIDIFSIGSNISSSENPKKSYEKLIEKIKK